MRAVQPQPRSIDPGPPPGAPWLGQHAPWRSTGRPEQSAMSHEPKPERAGSDAARLIEAIAASRDSEAFTRLFEHFAPRVKSLMLRSGATSGQAEELAQETLLTVWRKADLFDSARAGPAAWIFTIARNLRIDGLRRAGREANAVMNMDVAPGEGDRLDDLFITSE